MADDDEAARKARAEQLRRQIANLKSGDAEVLDTSEDESEAESNGAKKKHLTDKEARLGVNPRDFIHRRMRELERDKR
jgi:hypothetical protein